MKKHINWVSHNELNANNELGAKVNRLKKHNLFLELFIASTVGVNIVLATVLAAKIWG